MTATLVRTDPFDFVGANIKGWPPMNYKRVQHDVDLIKQKVSVAALQEYRWPWYWRVLQAGTVLSRKGQRRVNRKKRKEGDPWRSSPTPEKGFLKSTWGAQALLWDRRVWKLRDTKIVLLHPGRKDETGKGISEDRYIRAVLLENVKSGLRAWFWSTHFVVGGDRSGDGAIRKGMLRHDIVTLGRFLHQLIETGYPIIGQMDANIGKDSQAYPLLKAMLKGVDGRIVGEHGIEYLIVIDGDGKNGKQGKVKVLDDWMIGPKRIETDHEMRGAELQLEGFVLAA